QIRFLILPGMPSAGRLAMLRPISAVPPAAVPVVTPAIVPTEYPPDNGIRLPENAISPTAAATAAKLIEPQIARDASRAADVSVLTVVGLAGLSSSGSASVTPTSVGVARKSSRWQNW